LDYDELEKQALLFRPQLLVCGASAYPRDWDYKRLRDIADKVGCVLLCDMAHYSGLVAAALLNNPFDHCDIVTTTTHKSLRGPRAGMIFFRKGSKPVAKEGDPVVAYDFEERVNTAVFPTLQGGPHENQIGAIAVALREAQTPEFVEYSRQVIKNSQALGQALVNRGYTLVTGGTDNHLVLWDVRPQHLTGNKLEKLYELVSISVNKNSVYGDSSALAPGGVRLGTPAMTTRGLGEKDMETIAEFLHRGVQIALQVQTEQGTLLKAFLAGLQERSDVQALKHDVEEFASQFFMPG